MPRSLSFCGPWNFRHHVTSDQASIHREPGRETRDPVRMSHDTTQYGCLDTMKHASKFFERKQFEKFEQQPSNIYPRIKHDIDNSENDSSDDKGDNSIDMEPILTKTNDSLKPRSGGSHLMSNMLIHPDFCAATSTFPTAVYPYPWHFFNRWQSFPIPYTTLSRSLNQDTSEDST